MPKPAIVASRSPLRWYRWGLLTCVLVASAWLFWAVRAILLPFILAMVLAYLMAPVVEVIASRMRIHRVLAILVVYAILASGVALVVVYAVPVLIQQSVQLIRQVPKFAVGIQGNWDYWLTRFHQAPIPPSIRTAIQATGSHLQGDLLKWLKSLLHVLFGLVPGVLSLLIAPILAFYVLKDLARIRRRFWLLVPVEWHGAVFKLGFDIDRALNGFIRGQLIVALVVGLLSTLWMLLLGMPDAVLVGALAAITDVIPYVGPIAGAIPAVALALARSPLEAVWVVAGFILIHQLEGAVIGPKVVGDSVGLHPLVVVFAILAGGDLAGLSGVLLGVPVAAVLRVFLTHLYRRLSVTLDRHSTPSVE